MASTSLAPRLTGLSTRELECILSQLPISRRGRPWARSLRQRLVIVCTALRTNLTIRELGTLFRASRSQVHRILRDLVPRLASLLGLDVDLDRRWSWAVHGTLIPTRDHVAAGRSKNYRWSCNAQVLVRPRDLRVIAVCAGGPGNRNDPIHYRGSIIQSLCLEHGRVLADGAYRGFPELVTPVFARNRIVRDSKWRHHRRRRARIEHALARLKDWRVLRVIAAAPAPSHRPSQPLRSSTTCASACAENYGTLLRREGGKHGEAL